MGPSGRYGSVGWTDGYLAEPAVAFSVYAQNIQLEV